MQNWLFQMVIQSARNFAKAGSFIVRGEIVVNLRKEILVDIV